MTSTSDIKIGAVGRIVEGDDEGHFVKVQDDGEATGGFLVLLSPDETFRSGGDDWVGSFEDLEKYFQESHWVVKWLS